MATYKHLRSSTANKRPTTAIADGQLALNTNTASPGLFFKDSAGTGIVKIGPVHVGTTAPNSTPAAGGSSGNYKGEGWLDTSVSPAQLKVWDGSAWVGVVADELPVSKLQDGAARQLLQTDAAGTGVEWTSNIDVPGTLDVTGASTLDSTLSVAGVSSFASGTAGAPTITFTGDTNTGLYSPGADQVAISTNGTERVEFGTSEVAFNDGGANYDFRIEGDTDANLFFVDASTDRVGIGTASPASRLTVSDGTTSGLTPFGDSDVFINSSGGNYLQFGSGSSSSPAIYFGDSADGDVGGIIYSHASDFMSFRTNASERLRIDSSGRLLVGTSTSITTAIDPGLQVHGTGPQAYMNVGRWSNNVSGPGFLFGKSRGASVGTRGAVTSEDVLGDISFFGDNGTSFNNAASILGVVDGVVTGGGANDMPGRLVFSTTADGASSPTERMRLDSSGRVGIGVTSPNSSLEVRGGEIRFGDASASATSAGRISYGGGTGELDLNAYSAGGSTVIKFLTSLSGSNSERVRIDSSSLLVGTSIDSGGALLQVNGNRIRIATAKTPASATDTGTAGEVCWDANYVYVCVATNTWKRSAISTW